MQEALGVHRSEPVEDRLHQHKRLALWQPTAGLVGEVLVE